MLTASVELVADINAGSGTGSAPTQFQYFDGRAYFIADDGLHGTELWKTDGTASGTVLVRNFGPVAANGVNTAAGSVVFAASDRLYVWANDGEHGTEVWTSDGTPAGSQMLADLNPTSPATNSAGFAELDGKVYFGTFFNLYRTDGTSAGTQVLQTGVTSVANPTTVGDKIFYAGGALKNVLHVVNTSGVDVILKSFSPSAIRNFANIGGTLYFNADDGSHGAELWKSDGTSSGTQLVKDISNGSSSRPSHLTELNGKVVFTASTSLYVSDGTSAGTQALGPATNVDSARPLARLGDYVYYVNGKQLWKSNGTAAGTSMVFNFSAGGLSDNATVSHGRVYFTANDGTHGNELWSTDGTSAGTSLVADIQSGSAGSNPLELADMNGTLYFSADDGLIGRELWRVNTPPVADMGGPTTTLRDAATIFTLHATDALPADQLAGFDFTIDWGDGSAIEHVSGPSATQVSHTFGAVGPRNVTVTATDQSGAVSSSATLAVEVSALQLVTDGGLIDLVWTGTAGDDHVTFEDLGGGDVRVTTTLENGLATNFVETISGVTGIVNGKGLAGSDTLDGSLLLTTSTRLDGGTGNNTLYGGGANDVLIGGGNVAPKNNGPEGQQGSNIIVGDAGDDTIYGNAVNGAEGKGGNNILLGGDGEDTIYGNWTDGGEGGGRNIIVGGADADTLYDYKIADGAEGKGSILIADDTTLGVLELSQVMLEWDSTHTYTDRLNNILGPGSIGRLNGSAYLQPGSNVSSDAAVDQLWGTTTGAAFNWFLYTTTVDEINRAKAGEEHSLLS